MLRKYFAALRFFPSLPDVKTTMIYTHVLNRGGRGVARWIRYDEKGWPGRYLENHIINSQLLNFQGDGNERK